MWIAVLEKNYSAIKLLAEKYPKYYLLKFRLAVWTKEKG